MTVPIGYHPEQRSVASRILTPAGWITGALHLPLKAQLIEFLNRPEPLFRLTDVTLPGHRDRHPFFALERAAARAVVPLDAGDPLDPDRATRHTVSHRVAWLLPDGVVIDGLLDLLEGVRVSDHLMHRIGFVVLRDCTLFLRDGVGAVTAEPGVAELALQAGAAIGVSELG